MYCVENRTCVEIAPLLGCSDATVRNTLVRLGIPRRPSRQRPGHKGNHRGLPGNTNGNWKGGRTVTPQGYPMIRMPDHPDAKTNGYLFEHRWVMEQKLGRRLRPFEVVHHLDGNKKNNSPENLELFDSNGAHISETTVGKFHGWSESRYLHMLCLSAAKSVQASANHLALEAYARKYKLSAARLLKLLSTSERFLLRKALKPAHPGYLPESLKAHLQVPQVLPALEMIG